MYIILLLQGAEPSLIGMWPLFAMFAVMWFFWIRPQNKKQKEQKAFIMEELQKGDEVSTTSGMIGKITKIDGNIVTLQVDTKTFIRVTKGSISKEMTEFINNGAVEES